MVSSRTPRLLTSLPMSQNTPTTALVTNSLPIPSALGSLDAYISAVHQFQVLSVEDERADSEDNQMELLREGLANLDERSRDIIKRRWLDGESKITLQELADEYGISAERVRQVEANALKKMRALFTA